MNEDLAKEAKKENRERNKQTNNNKKKKQQTKSGLNLKHSREDTRNSRNAIFLVDC